MKTRSAKAKGRVLQNLVRDTLREVFKDTLEPGDIESRQMGGSGVDVILSPAAKKLIVFDIEAKNQERLNVTEALKQASDNANKGRVPLLIFKRNHGKVYVALEFDNFMKLLYNADVQQILAEIKKREEVLVPNASIKPPEFKEFAES